MVVNEVNLLLVNILANCIQVQPIIHDFTQEKLDVNVCFGLLGVVFLSILQLVIF